jgi:alkylation response protein AidB-like acyl-CoA dehydrogenase
VDFRLTEEQQAYKSLARQFAENELAPNAAQWDQQQIFPKDVLRKAGDLGFLSLYCPEEAGGLGLSRLDASIVFEELSAGCTSTTAFMTIHNMALWMIASFGTQKVKADVCPKLTSGEHLVSYCLTEPGAGSDAAALKATAVRTEGGYRLSGTKAFISGAGDTDILVVMARVADENGVREGAGGISSFVVRGDARGVSYGRKEDKMGWNSQPTRQVNFEDVELNFDALLGAEGDGFKIAMKGLDGGRINIATCSLGTAMAALEQAVSYMGERKAFGDTLKQFQGLQFKIADMATDLVASRQMIRLAATKLDDGDSDATLYAAMAKKFATDACFEICNQALQIHGGYGYTKEYPLERYVRDTRVHQILEGTNEIMRVIVARKIMLQENLEILQ